MRFPVSVGSTFGCCGGKAHGAVMKTCEEDFESITLTRSEMSILPDSPIEPISTPRSVLSSESDEKISIEEPVSLSVLEAPEPSKNRELLIEVLAASLVKLEDSVEQYFASCNGRIDFGPFLLPSKIQEAKNVSVRLLAAKIADMAILVNQLPKSPIKELELVEKLIQLFYFQISGDFSKNASDSNIALRDFLFRLTATDSEALLMPALKRLDQIGFIDVMYEISLRDCPAFAGGLPEDGEARETVLRAFARRIRSFGVLRPTKSLGQNEVTKRNRGIDKSLENTKLTATLRQLLFLRTLENTPSSTVSQALIRHAVQNLETMMKRIETGVTVAVVRTS